MALLAGMLVNNAFGCGPICGVCEKLIFVGGNWLCVDKCYPQSCCNGTCYDGQTKECCDGRSLCNWNDCMSCIGNGSGTCGSWCDPNKCETCDGHKHCLPCNGDTWIFSPLLYRLS